MEVEVREEASPGSRSGDSTVLLVNNTPVYPIGEGPVVIVRVEEVLLVVLVLMIWVAAIALFFNRWGKIRMLEPYQPKFHQPHRPSCPLAPLSPPGVPQVSNTVSRAQKPTTQRMSFSKYNVNAMTDPLSALPSPIIRRPRQNSVFVGSSATMAILNPPPRRAKSAIDIQHMVVNEHSPTSLTGSLMIPIFNRDRRPSITVERPRHRPSIAILDRPLPPVQRYRRSSCFVERPSRYHRNFISFDHPTNDRKTSINNERPSSSYHQPTITFEAHVEPSVKVDIVPPKLPKASRSFEQPPKEKPKPDRMANSLEISSDSFDRRYSIPEEDRSSPVFICMDESKITAPLLEGLKSSDV